MLEIDKGNGRKWAVTLKGWAEMPSDYDSIMLNPDQIENDPQIRLLTPEEAEEAEAVPDPDNPKLPDPPRPSPERAAWLLTPLGVFGRLNIQASQYEELRGLALAQHEELRQLKPGPQATSWAEDYRLGRFWFARCLEVWAAIPVEFRGPATLEAGGPRTLVEKIEAMVKEIERLRTLSNSDLAASSVQGEKSDG